MLALAAGAGAAMTAGVGVPPLCAMQDFLAVSRTNAISCSLIGVVALARISATMAAACTSQAVAPEVSASALCTAPSRRVVMMSRAWPRRVVEL